MVVGGATASERRTCEPTSTRLPGAGAVYRSQTLNFHAPVKIGDVVDSNLKTEKENLYVCDCSVMPAAWGIPPTLTLLSLGKRLAKHLGENMK